MKRTALILLVFAFTACKYIDHNISFEIKTPGLNGAVFMVKNNRDSVIFSENIINGSVNLKDKLFNQANDYYYLYIYDLANKRRIGRYDVYLEPGTYTITADTNIYAYPQIKSSSKTQQQLSDFYAIYNADRKREAKRSTGLAPIIEKKSFLTYIKQHPESEVSAHIFAAMDYESDPKESAEIFAQLSPTAQASDDGKEIGQKLTALMRLMPGAEAPAIAGTTPEGKPFNKAALDKKLYLVEFWKIGNDLSQMEHQNFPNIVNQVGAKDFGIISVSLDSRRDWWVSAIGDNHLNWTHYSDLKGEDSPNVANWSITRIPVYYLVDGKWRIVERDLMPAEIQVTAQQYLKHHP